MRTNERMSDAEARADWLVVCALETDANAMMEEHEPALSEAASQLLNSDRDATQNVGVVLVLDALLATPDAATTMVRQIRDALLIEISEQCREELDAEYRELRKTLHE